MSPRRRTSRLLRMTERVCPPPSGCMQLDKRHTRFSKSSSCRRARSKQLFRRAMRRRLSRPCCKRLGRRERHCSKLCRLRQLPTRSARLRRLQLRRKLQKKVRKKAKGEGIPPTSNVHLRFIGFARLKLVPHCYCLLAHSHSFFWSSRCARGSLCSMLECVDAGLWYHKLLQHEGDARASSRHDDRGLPEARRPQARRHGSRHCEGGHGTWTKCLL
mmetsp:Transcript_8116/g.25352  ORF Transcript_8116/g.25352 Transcript_8116/m.25352 type:complete len:216 (-) Transcript_8116:199-846(-)